MRQPSPGTARAQVKRGVALDVRAHGPTTTAHPADRSQAGVSSQLRFGVSPEPCFRPSAGGSIAARRRGRRRRRGHRLFPPLRGRLHCGRDWPEVAKRIGYCFRPSAGGSIAARPTWSRSTCPPTPVSAPPRAAPLRPAEPHPDLQRVQLFPPLRGRLHCGNGYPKYELSTMATCYRPSAGGSIAARRRSAPSGRACPLFPPLRGRLHCGCSAIPCPNWSTSLFPPLRGPAPLRRPDVQPAQELVRPVSAPPRAAPLRHVVRRTEVDAGGGLFPPLRGRLHCGTAELVIAWQDPATIPPSPRAAPLRLGRRPATDGRQQPIPPSPRAAPLRPLHPVAFAALVEDLFRPLRGRLHCGEDIAFLRGTGVCELFPPLRGRLHCGGSVFGMKRHSGWYLLPPPRAAPLRPEVVVAQPAHRQLFPPLRGRLHCGGYDYVEARLQQSTTPRSVTRSVLVVSPSRCYPVGPQPQSGNDLAALEAARRGDLALPLFTGHRRRAARPSRPR